MSIPQSIHRLIAALLLSLAICEGAGCGVANASPADRFRYCYIEAVRQQDMGNYGEAFDLFQRCYELCPDAPEANYALAAFYLVMNQDSIAMRFLKRAVELEPQNDEFAERLARTYLAQENVLAAAEVYERLATLQPDRTEYLEILGGIYGRERDYEKVLSALDRIELREGKSENLTLTKMQAYSYMGDQDGAYRELKSLIDLHPNDMNLQVMLGNWLLGNGRKEEAHATFQRVLQEEPDNAQGQMSLMDFYRAEGNDVEADSLLYGVLVNPRTEPLTRLTMIRDWIKNTEGKGGDSLHVMQMFDRVLALPQKTSEVAEARVAYLIFKEAPHDSIRTGWEKVLEITPENISARLELIKIMWEDSIDENVINQCRLATEYVPNEPVLYMYLGIAQYANQHNTDAIATLRRGAANITEDTPAETSSEIYQILGDALYKEGLRQEAYNAYDSCLVYKPDLVMCLNNYAYFLSLERKDLKKAEKMSYRAITAEPENSTYLDTYAWILYQQKRYEEACIYIELAIKCDTDSLPTSGDIYEHAGDIYFRLNRPAEAMEMWKKALTMEVEDEAALRRKIKRGKL